MFTEYFQNKVKFLFFRIAGFAGLTMILGFCSCASIPEKRQFSNEIETVWNFNNLDKPFEASAGSAILNFHDPLETGWGEKSTKFGKTRKFDLPAINGKDVNVMAFPTTNNKQGYALNHNSPPNGVFANPGLVSNYTLVFDILWPKESFNTYRAFFQTDSSGLSDAEFFAQDKINRGIGISGVYNGHIYPNKWYRIAIAVQCALGSGGTGQIHKYIDGNFVGGHYTPGVDKCRWALEDKLYLFTDNNGDTAKGYLSSLMYIDKFMTMSEIKALGGVSPEGANVPGKKIISQLKKSKKRVKIIAHRANSGDVPENTISGIKKSFDVGADIVEVDIRVSAEGIPILLHDAKIDRTTTGNGKASQIPLSGLKKFEVGSWFRKEYSQERIPTLTEALIAAKGRGKLLLDIKSINIAGNIKKSLKKAGVSEDAVWLWQNKRSRALIDFKKHLPKAEILWGGLPEPMSKEGFDKLKDMGVVGFDIDISLVNKEFLDAAHENGMFVSVYTVLAPDTMLEMIELGVDGMETDFPSVLNSIMPKK